MGKISFNPIEIAYKIIGERPVIELYGRSGEKQVCVQVKGFEPYFWSIGESDVSDEKIVRVEEHKKNFLGKEVIAKKIFVNQPSDVPILRTKFRSLEADIPYTRRYLIDSKMTPLLTYEAEGDFVESTYKTDVFAASKISYVSDDLPKFRILAVDIETHTLMDKEILPENDPIIMVAVYGENFKKVLTWKHFDTTLDSIEVLDSEVAMIERFGQIVADYKPDILTGYFSDGFDLPYLKARAEKYKIKLNLGLDNSPIRTRPGKLAVSEITGIAHMDVFKFIRRIFRTSMNSFKLDHVAKELLDEGKDKVDLGKLYRAWTESNQELDKFAKYNLQDARLTYALCEKVMPNAIEFTKLIGLPPAEVSRMSFSQLVELYLMREAANFNELAPNKPEFNEERQRRAVSYEGGFVYEPVPGLYKDVLVFDFMSLYPTVISAHNISPDTIIYGQDSSDGVLKGYSFTDKKRGFISTVIESVIERRLRIKELAKQSNDKLLDARQLGLKTIANSIYGYYGFFGARWYNIDCAKAITAYGRHHIQEVIKKAKEEGLQVLYSDTDSVFIALNGKMKAGVLDFVEKINSELPGIMGLEYEGYYKSGIFVATKGTETGAKKKYALMKENGKMKVRGFETVRRNLSAIAKETQEKVLQMILEGGENHEVAKYVKEIIMQLRIKAIPVEKVIIRTQLSRDIKGYANMPPHVAIALRMQQQGKRITAGTAIPYIVTEGKSIIRERAKLPEEVKGNEYDAEYYVMNQVIPAVSRIMEVIGYDSTELAESHKQKKLENFFN